MLLYLLAGGTNCFATSDGLTEYATQSCQSPFPLHVRLVVTNATLKCFVGKVNGCRGTKKSIL